MNDMQEDLLLKMMDEFSKTIEMFGLSTTEARLFAYLFLYKEPLTLDEMSKALGKSKTSISTCMRSLVDANLVIRVWQKGMRKDLYQADRHLFKPLVYDAIKKWKDRADQQQANLENLTNFIQNNPNKQFSSTLIESLKEVVDFHQQIKAMFQNMQENKPS